jgi:hypothetical protein
MAKVNENSILRNIRGHIGKQVVVKVTNGQPIMTDIPKAPKKKRSPAVRKQNSFFKIAAHTAKRLIKDPVERTRYEAARRPGQSAYNVALSECLRRLGPNKENFTPAPPYRKRTGKKIQPKDITLLLDTDDGTLVETGLVVQDENLKWILAAAREKTTKKVRKIVLRISCG